MQPRVSVTDSVNVRRHTLATVGCIVALGAVVLTIAVLERGASPTAWRFIVAVLLVAASELLRLPIWHRGERLTIGWGEAAVLVSCGLVHAPWLVIASCAGQILAQTIVRKPLIKATFNVADFTAAAGVVALLVPWSGNLRELAQPRHLPFLFIAGLAFSLITAVAVATVVGASTGGNWRQAMRSFNGISLLTTLSNVVFASAVVWLAWWSPRSLIVLPPVIVALAHHLHRLPARAAGP